MWRVVTQDTLQKNTKRYKNIAKQECRKHATFLLIKAEAK